MKGLKARIENRLGIIWGIQPARNSDFLIGFRVGDGKGYEGWLEFEAGGKLFGWFFYAGRIDDGS